MKGASKHNAAQDRRRKCAGAEPRPTPALPPVDATASGAKAAGKLKGRIAPLKVGAMERNRNSGSKQTSPARTAGLVVCRHLLPLRRPRELNDTPSA
jgi:hypothetical protein